MTPGSCVCSIPIFNTKNTVQYIVTTVWYNNVLFVIIPVASLSGTLYLFKTYISIGWLPDAKGVIKL